MRADARQKLACDERFGDIVTHAGAEAADQVFAIVVGGQEDDGQVDRFGRAAQLAQDFEAVHVGHANVQQYQVRSLAQRQCDAFFATQRGDG